MHKESCAPFSCKCDEITETDGVNMSEWISVEDRLPPINKEIEIKLTDGDDNEYFSKGAIRRRNRYTLFLDVAPIKYRADSILTHWRPIPEKRPDFSKLNNNEHVVIYFDPTFHAPNNYYVGVIREITDSRIRLSLSPYYITSADTRLYEGFELKFIKKITRINLEEKTLEEI